MQSEAVSDVNYCESEETLKKRLANINDVPILVELRKRQLIDEGLPPMANIDTNIDTQIADYFITAIAEPATMIAERRSGAWIAFLLSRVHQSGVQRCVYKH